MSLYEKGVPESEIEIRIKKLQSVMEKKGISGSLILQKSDLFYFSGTVQQGWLYIPAQGDPVFMVFKEFERAQAETNLKTLVSVVSPKKIPSVLEEYACGSPRVIGMELDVLPANLYFLYKSIFKDTDIVDISMDIRLIRGVKSDHELNQIKKAAEMSDKVAGRAAQLIEPGKNEITLAGELEAYCRSLGHQGIIRMRLWGSEIFYGHIMSGSAAAVPSYMASPTGGLGTGPATGQGAGFKAIEKNEPVLVDYVFALNGYLSDHARIFSIGPLDDHFLKAHEAMLEIQETAKTKGCIGMPAGELYDILIKKAEEKGYSDIFMGVGDRKIRFIGHGIGLELDEFPFIAKGQTLPLEKNMVFALEPKVIMPGKGVVGIENTFAVTEKGLDPLAEFPDRICTLSP
ncbi:MAG: Xaa-Pro peptidase family protein [Desulfobacteraceae bacterium]